VVADAPATVDQESQLINAHVHVVIERTAVGRALPTELPGDDIDVAGKAELLVDRKRVGQRIDGALVVGHRVGEWSVLEPSAD
jgi:hypothetical protein